MKEVAAIVVTYNPELKILKEELNALRSQVEFLVIVDNASESEGRRSLKEIVSLRDSFIVNQSNRGIAAALNQGVEKAILLKASYVLLMDQDSIPQDGFVEALRSEFMRLSEVQKIAAVGPVIVDCFTSNQFPAVRYSYFWRNHIAVPSQKTILCDQIISSGTFMSIESYETIGEFDESLFIDFVDIDWGLRAKSKGYSCAMTNKTQLKHQLGDEAKKFWIGRWRQHNLHSPLRSYYIARNPWLLLRKRHLPLGYRIGEMFYSLMRLLITPLLAVEKLPTLIACLRGTLDGILDRRSL